MREIFKCGRSIVLNFWLWKTVFVEILRLLLNTIHIIFYKGVAAAEDRTSLGYHNVYSACLIFFIWIRCHFWKPNLNLIFCDRKLYTRRKASNGDCCIFSTFFITFSRTNFWKSSTDIFIYVVIGTSPQPLSVETLLIKEWIKWFFLKPHFIAIVMSFSSAIFTIWAMCTLITGTYGWSLGQQWRSWFHYVFSEQKSNYIAKLKNIGCICA